MEPTRFSKGEFTGDLHVGGNLTVDGTYPSGGSGGGGDVFAINFTTDDEWTTIEADKTYSETLAAINSGAPVYAAAIETYDDATYTDTLANIQTTGESIVFTGYSHSTDGVNHRLWVMKFEYFPDNSVVRTLMDFALSSN